MKITMAQLRTDYGRALDVGSNRCHGKVTKIKIGYRALENSSWPKTGRHLRDLDSWFGFFKVYVEAI
jgi:hypothetical protein